MSGESFVGLVDAVEEAVGGVGAQFGGVLVDDGDGWGEGVGHREVAESDDGDVGAAGGVQLPDDRHGAAGVGGEDRGGWVGQVQQAGYDGGGVGVPGGQEGVHADAAVEQGEFVGGAAAGGGGDGDAVAGEGDAAVAVFEQVGDGQAGAAVVVVRRRRRR